jgi:hypothetical protein
MRRIRLISIVVAVILLGGMAIAIFRAREPRYQGRTLTEWIERAEPASNKSWVHPSLTSLWLYDPTDPAWQAASNAVKQIGPDAVPLLLKWAQTKDSPSKSKLIAWLHAHPSLHFQFKPADEYHFRALFGFASLGNEAKPAWPALKQMIEDRDSKCRICALNCLAKSQPDQETLLPVLLRLIHDPDRHVQYNAGLIFRSRYSRDAETAGVYKIFPGWKNFLTPQTNAGVTSAK